MVRNTRSKWIRFSSFLSKEDAGRVAAYVNTENITSQDELIRRIKVWEQSTTTLNLMSCFDGWLASLVVASGRYKS